MDIRKGIAALAIAVSLVGGAAACDSGQGYVDNGQYAEVEYGYYTPSHLWIEYSTPHVVYVTHSYYVSHGSLFVNPRHVAAPRGVRIGVSRTGTTYGSRTTTRGTRVTSGCNSCRPGGGGTRYGSGTRSSSGGSRSGRR